MKFIQILEALGVDATKPLPAWLLRAEVAPHQAGEQSDEIVHVSYEDANNTLYLEYE